MLPTLTVSCLGLSYLLKLNAPTYKHHRHVAVYLWAVLGLEKRLLIHVEDSGHVSQGWEQTTAPMEVNPSAGFGGYTGLAAMLPGEFSAGWPTSPMPEPQCSSTCNDKC